MSRVIFLQDVVKGAIIRDKSKAHIFEPEHLDLLRLQLSDDNTFLQKISDGIRDENIVNSGDQLFIDIIDVEWVNSKAHLLTLRIKSNKQYTYMKYYFE